MHNPILQDPAEGSRDVVERELRRLERRKEPPKAPSKASADDILRALGELSPDRIAAILALGPTQADLELAALWAQGDGDLPAMYGHMLTGKPATIIDIVRPDWEDDERP
jgi:hypothetical protein